MDFSLTDDQQNIRDAVLKHCARFSDEYWLERDREGTFPEDFYQSMVEAGWLGVAMPEACGGSGLGIAEALDDKGRNDSASIDRTPPDPQDIASDALLVRLV